VKGDKVSVNMPVNCFGSFEANAEGCNASFGGRSAEERSGLGQSSSLVGEEAPYAIEGRFTGFHRERVEHPFHSLSVLLQYGSFKCALFASSKAQFSVLQSVHWPVAKNTKPEIPKIRTIQGPMHTGRQTVCSRRKSATGGSE